VDTCTVNLHNDRKYRNTS